MAASDDPVFEIGLTRVGGQPPDGRPGRPNRPPLKIILALVLMLAIPAVANSRPRVGWRPVGPLVILPPPTPTPHHARTPHPTPGPHAHPPTHVHIVTQPPPRLHNV